MSEEKEDMTDQEITKQKIAKKLRKQYPKADIGYFIEKKHYEVPK